VYVPAEQVSLLVEPSAVMPHVLAHAMPSGVCVVQATPLASPAAQVVSAPLPVPPEEVPAVPEPAVPVVEPAVPVELPPVELPPVAAPAEPPLDEPATAVEPPADVPADVLTVPPLEVVPPFETTVEPPFEVVLPVAPFEVVLLSSELPHACIATANETSSALAETIANRFMKKAPAPGRR
jgi:hypothetical protein